MPSGLVVQSDIFLDGCSVRVSNWLCRRVISLFHHPRKNRFVLRKKPAGKLLSATAHQVEREYTILHALHEHNSKPTTPPERRVPVPQPIILCRDSEVIGTLSLQDNLKTRARPMISQVL